MSALVYVFMFVSAGVSDIFFVTLFSFNLFLSPFSFFNRNNLINRKNKTIC